MNKLKENLAVKVTAFILFVVILLMTVACAAVVLVNLESRWYSRSEEQVEEGINHEIAYNIAEEVYKGSGDLQYDKKKRGAFDYEYYEDENATEASAEYGVEIESIKWKLTEKAKTEKIQNQVVYTETFEFYDGYPGKVKVYLADPKKGGYGEFDTISKFYHMIYEFRQAAIVLGIIGLFASVYLFVFLMTAAGRRKDGIRLWIIDRIPLEVYLTVVISLCAIGFVLIGQAINSEASIEIVLSGVLALGAGCITIITAFSMSLAARAKKGKWWQCSLIYYLYRLIRYEIGNTLCIFFKFIGGLLKQLPLVAKTAVAFGIFSVAQFLAIVMFGWTPGVLILLWLLQTICLGILVIYTALGLRKLKAGGERLAKGELDCQIDKKGLYLDLAEHADHLNSIGAGMAKAVQEQMKSEHFRTELITNVSHDIKTPLTSIINYVDLLKKEDVEDETIKGYIKVLDRQSQRMKKLTDDLVEASKAATGAVKIEMMPCEAGMLINQAIGEYEERSKVNDLKIITKMPEQELMVMADGKRLWRVFDNLLSNICKYAQSGTRVYIDLYKEAGKAVIIFKNISQYELNITEEELMERFVRGDSSRHTEGSGLGLSISRNLIELQGGTFDLHVDGDLFKVTVRMNLVEKR